MARHIAPPVADRLGGGTPERAGLIVPYVNGLANGITDRIVRPGRDLVLAAITGPGVKATLARHLKAKALIGDNVDPGGGGRRAMVQHGHIFRAIARKPAEPIEELQIVGPVDRLGRGRQSW
ncbi:hypothetical protein D3C86_1920610 [compost metagenome]